MGFQNQAIIMVDIVNYMIFQRFLLIFVLSALFLLPFSSVKALEDELRPAPEIATGVQATQVAIGRQMMVVTAHPEATKAAYTMLDKGGNAIDAAIAAQLVLGLVEPQSSGLGGGAFALYFDAQSKKIISFDGRETAPQDAGEYLFIDQDGKPMKFFDAALGGRAVGVPGVPRLLETMHARDGALPWVVLFEPAIDLAQKGFTVTPRLSKMLSEGAAKFRHDVKTKLYFFPDSVNPLEAGDTRDNLFYAQTLKNLAADGADVFYKGQMAEDIVSKVRGAVHNPGSLSVEDMAAYQVKMRNPVCGSYRGYQICSMPEPSSGGLTLLQILKLLERFDLAVLGPDNPKSWHIIAEASRLAFADRNKYMADGDFVKTPAEGLLENRYIQERTYLISVDTPFQSVYAGVPSNMIEQVEQGSDFEARPPSTTHISIVDAVGNIVSMTSSIESAFGSHLMVNGFLLNSELTDFSFQPFDKEGNPIANRVEGGKRPRSSVTPTIVFDPDGQPFMVIGSAGGSRIIGFVLQRIIAAIDWGLPIDESLEMPNILHRGEKLEVETSAMDLAEPLMEIGHAVLVGDMNSGLTAIQFVNGQIIGAADPRREGTAMGR